MQNGCPKCGGSDIRSRLSEIPGAGYEGSTPTRIYVCAECGYSETYVVPAALAQLDISTLWKRIPAQVAPGHAAPATGQTTRLYPADGETTRLPVASAAARTSADTCLNCGSKRIVRHILVRDAIPLSSKLLAEVPLAFRQIVGRPLTSNVTARLCGDCGALSLFVTDPRKLYEAAS